MFEPTLSALQTKRSNQSAAVPLASQQFSLSCPSTALKNRWSNLYEVRDAISKMEKIAHQEWMKGGGETAAETMHSLDTGIQQEEECQKTGQNRQSSQYRLWKGKGDQQDSKN